MSYLKQLLFMSRMIARWLPGAIKNRFTLKRHKPVHILFCMVDHYEPGTGKVGKKKAQERVDLLLSEYPKMAVKHRDSAGNHPKRTWFFPPHYHSDYFLKQLVGLCEKGFGEIELHLHHGKCQPDTSENLEFTINQCIEEYSRFGIFGTVDGQIKYAFIHGDWALDNSRNGEFCGVNNELDILTKTGCFADFTFPSMNESNPSSINCIYYATDDPNEPKSYDKGIPVTTSGNRGSGLMIIQGPVYPFFKNRNPLSLRIYGDEIASPFVTPARIDAWVKTGISIKGKENWVIVKTHTHGATDSEAVLGPNMDAIHKHLENKYNDGENYILHYVSARELYNIIKAIEAGEQGENPELYRDYRILPPKYDSSPDIPAASEKLQNFVGYSYRS